VVGTSPTGGEGSSRQCCSTIDAHRSPAIFLAAFVLFVLFGCSSCFPLLVHALSVEPPLLLWIVTAIPANIGCKRYETFVQIDTDQLTQRATHRVEPDSPLLNSARVQATVVVKVFVDKKGRVVCDRIVGDANPFLGRLALEAARAWTFEPLLKQGHPTGMKGDLVFHIER